MLEGLDVEQKKVVPLAWTAEQIDPHTVRVRMAPGYKGAVFYNRWRDLEILISAPDSEETWRVKLQSATDEQTITVSHDDGVIEVKYARRF